jgi:hypothetical protein
MKTSFRPIALVRHPGLDPFDGLTAMSFVEWPVSRAFGALTALDSGFRRNDGKSKLSELFLGRASWIPDSM